MFRRNLFFGSETYQFVELFFSDGFDPFFSFSKIPLEICKVEYNIEENLKVLEKKFGGPNWLCATPEF